MTVRPDYDLQSALNQRLSDEFPSMQIGWENDSYNPTVGVPWLTSYLLPAESVAKTLGPDPVIERVGVFQVNCMYPIGDGWGPARAKAAEVVAAFKAGLGFVYNGISIRIVRASPGPGASQENGWYKVPVNIRYSCQWRD